ncbi:MAG TPA: DUF4097 family beta strand repeat-containing protein [Vicinamibacterales bacterium]|nr:DUF4097 family beta strand repeat-containing protein [Vicinamibacterales bacterium]
MRIHLLPLAVLAMAFPIAGAVPAAAQRLSFERAIDVMPGATLDVSTIRGKIAVRADDGRQIRIDGTVTVRVGVTVPANALELAQRVADHPRVDVADNVVRLRPPIDADELRAVTVSYVVRVPRDTGLIIATDSGAITVDDVAAAVVVTTQSSAVALSGIDGKTEIKTGSGDIRVDRASGGLRVVTQSSAITLRGLSGPLDARTQSGAVRASFAGAGAADVETGSSAIQIDGLTGGLTVRTQSGRVEVRGNPTAAWSVSTGSSLIDVALEPAARFTLEATSGSSSVQVRGVTVDGSAAKERVAGTVGGGGPTVRLASRSGQIHIGR